VTFAVITAAVLLLNKPCIPVFCHMLLEEWCAGFTRKQSVCICWESTPLALCVMIWYDCSGHTWLNSVKVCRYQMADCSKCPKIGLSLPICLPISGIRSFNIFNTKAVNSSSQPSHLFS
jgi:hypothetical protein